MELSMEIAFWTAKALARPVHALQRWWKTPSRTHAAGTSCLSDDSQTSSTATMHATSFWARGSKNNEGVNIQSLIAPSPCFSPSTLAAPIRLRLTCSSAAHTASPKNHRTNHCPTAPKNRDAPPPLRPMRCSASTPEAGHFFIAGRMADVCAELDRLAAREAAH